MSSLQRRHEASKRIAEAIVEMRERAPQQPEAELSGGFGLRVKVRLIPSKMEKKAMLDAKRAEGRSPQRGSGYRTVKRGFCARKWMGFWKTSWSMVSSV